MARKRKNAKRAIFSPDSAEKNPKKRKDSINNKDNNSNGTTVEEVENSSNTSNLSMDTVSLQELVSKKVAEGLQDFQSKSKQCGTDDTLLKLLPVLVSSLASAVATAIDEAFKGMLAALENRLANFAGTDVLNNQLIASVRRLTYENDALHQYSRRESVRIFGVLPEGAESQEVVEQKALRVIRDVGMEIEPNDIVAIHRVGKPGKPESGAILVRFHSRKKRSELMGKKKNLKSKPEYKKVFINDDLTPLRFRLLMYVKSVECVEKAWTVGGRIHCQLKTITSDGRAKIVTVESPDDLFKLGVNSVDYGRLGLGYLQFGEGCITSINNAAAYSSYADAARGAASNVLR